MTTITSTVTCTKRGDEHDMKNETKAVLTPKQLVKKTRKEKKVTRESVLRQNVFNKLPKDYQMSHSYYIRNYIHCFSYFILFFILYNLQYKLGLYSSSYLHSFSDVYSLFILLLTYVISPFVVGWSMLGIVGIGHDAVHKGFAPAYTKLGKFLNWFLLKMSWDILLSTTSQKDHMFHHKHANTVEDSSMILVSMNLGIIGEILHTLLFSFRKFSTDDVKLLLFNTYSNRPVVPKVSISTKLWIVVTLINRVLLILGVYYKFGDILSGNCNVSNFCELRPVIGLLNIFWGAFWLNMFAFAPHVSPAVVADDDDDDSEDEDDMYLYQLRNAWELYPKDGVYEHFQQWLHTGATMHVTHHCFTVIPRSFYSMVSNEISKVYENELRTIHSFNEEIKLYQTRTVFTSTQDIAKYQQKR